MPQHDEDTEEVQSGWDYNKSSYQCYSQPRTEDCTEDQGYTAPNWDDVEEEEVELRVTSGTAETSSWSVLDTLEFAERQKMMVFLEVPLFFSYFELFFFFLLFFSAFSFIKDFFPNTPGLFSAF